MGIFKFTYTLNCLFSIVNRHKQLQAKLAIFCVRLDEELDRFTENWTDSHCTHRQ